MAHSTVDWPNPKTTLIDRIGALFKSAQWSDCSFRVGQTSIKVFNAHRLILASCSPVFEAMCFGPLAEKNCIIVPDMEPEAFSILLEYVYTDNINFTSCEEAAGVLYAGKKYLMPHLARASGEYLETNLRPSNVLSIFEFAKALDEDKLMAACLKVMCLYTREVLKSSGSHLSLFTLRALLEQNSLNIKESELFKVALNWAKEECQRRELECTGENLRSILIEAGLLSKIRFLCFTVAEFTRGPLRSGILESRELFFFKKAMQMFRDSGGRKHFQRLVDVPTELNGAVKPRDRIPIVSLYCVRRFLKTAVTVTGRIRLLTSVVVDRSIVVSGVRIYTRLMPAYHCGIDSPPQKYKEDIKVSVLDPQGTIICHTHFTDVVEYNTLAMVTLQEAVRFGSNIDYRFLFVLPTGDDQVYEYPLSFMSQTESTRGIEFRFSDHADIASTGVFVCRLDMGYVNAISYSV